MNYKDTLLMPKTAFEMRGNLNKKEPKYVSKWQEESLYQKMLESRKDCPMFVLHDGPPYANGDIHIGHALNKILKDFIVRSRFMNGYQVPFIPGWDTHGLPIENAAIKMGFDRKKMPASEFRKACHNYALEQIKRQKEGFLRLGCVGDYENPYITLKKEYEARQIEVFAKMALDGLIYKGLKPVYWSPSSESALAEAEIEYLDHSSPSIYVRFPLTDGKGILAEENTYFLIWTTTPWTIPANLGICVNERLTYALVKSEKGNLVVLEELVDQLWKDLELEEKEILKTFKGKELEYMVCKHPLYERDSLVILGNHVMAESGTGCVHTAPGHGMDDFMVGLKYGLPAYCPVDEKGCLTQEAGEFVAGQFVDKANETVIEYLKKQEDLLKLQWIKHSYPHDWRTQKPIIFRATPQWFASVDKIRDSLLNSIETINWTPKWAQLRMHNMISDRGDWCISRQRLWGVPIPILYDEEKNPIIDKVLFDHFAKLFKEHGSNIWFEKEASELLPENYQCKTSPNHIFTKETDTMDVWFDSGSSHTGVLIERGLPYPCDLYLEGSDQYRGWFNSSLIVGQAVHQQAPYKAVLSHGFVMAAKGEKMSKSKGNAVVPATVMNTYGADILRLWVASIDYQADGRISDDILKQVSESYRKIRNTFRFMLGNVGEEDFRKEDIVDYDKLTIVDQHMLVRLKEVSDLCQQCYESYDFLTISSTITNFLTNEVSAYYLDFTKDILYIDTKDSLRRRQVQTTIKTMLETLVYLISPILVFTCEEINEYAHFEKESIHLGKFKQVVSFENDQEIKSKMEKILQIRTAVFKELENARSQKIIGKSLEAQVDICVDKDTLQLINDIFEGMFHQYLIVSKVTICEGDFKVCVKAFEGKTCPRCWNMHQEEGELCSRCVRVLEK